MSVVLAHLMKLINADRAEVFGLSLIIRQLIIYSQEPIAR